MELPFVKMQGAGNDYVYIDGFDHPVADPERLAPILADRHFGVGGDGLVLILPSPTADARMRMFNADGSEGKMCGNAIRCVGKYLYERRGLCRDQLVVDTLSGPRTLYLTVREGRVEAVRVGMGPAEFDAAKVPVQAGLPQVVGAPMAFGGEELAVTCVSMGNPHAVIFGGDPDRVALEQIGPVIEHDPRFPEGVNAEFVQVVDPHHLRLRVWERGSGETLACGTGACASVAAAVRLGHCPAGEPVQVQLRGGVLTIQVTPQQVWMTGGCAIVFDGVIQLPEA